MAKEICISSTPHETRLAILEDDQLAEIYYERENEYTLAGSIYNGRVTRVLPGMQSAFVDIGLERDAFLYVTDFLELEDQEETDELEKAAASGGSQPPREVRHSGAPDSRGEVRGGRSAQKPDQRPEQKQEPRPAQERAAFERPSPEKNVKERRLLIESAPEADEAIAPEPTFASEQTGAGEGDSGEPGAKRWRGRRRRRGGRGPAGSPEGQAEAGDTSRSSVEGIAETELQVAPEIHAAGVPADTPSSTGFVEPVHRFERATAISPTPFVLPGESLSKYGGAPVEGASADDATEPARPGSAFKPATLIESPIEWDGSGLLPGESLSRHASRHNEGGGPASEARIAPRELSSDALEIDAGAPDAVEEQEFFEETTLAAPEAIAPDAALEPSEDFTEVMPLPEPAEDHFAKEDLAEEELIEEEMTAETAQVAPQSPLGKPEPAVAAPATTENYAIGTAIDQPSDGEPLASPVTRQDEVLAKDAHDQPATQEADGTEPLEPDSDATASHNVDPLPPAGFRLFGFGGKKKAEAEAAKPQPKPASVAPASTYAPGSGLIEEEVIEEEEFDAPRHHHHGQGGDHETDDFEEETLPSQLRTGDLGEMLQEAHLDHRIQMNFDDKNRDEE